MRTAPRAEPWTFPIYSDNVCRALARIRKTHATEEAKLALPDRRELAEALQVLGLAAHLESQIAAHGTEEPPEPRDRHDPDNHSRAEFVRAGD